MLSKLLEVIQLSRAQLGFEPRQFGSRASALYHMFLLLMGTESWDLKGLPSCRHPVCLK